ncbi:MAG: hypothetical protein WC671_01865 [Candidatus Paceibacterota bacterium]|jgi:hypothetical protein
MEVIKVNIRLIEGNVARIYGRNLFRYKAEIIRCIKGFYYRANGVIIKITPLEAKHVIRNPRLYFFSTALKLHILTQRKNSK